MKKISTLLTVCGFILCVPNFMEAQIIAEPDYLLIGKDSLPKNGEELDDARIWFYDINKANMGGGYYNQSANLSPDSIGFASLAFGFNSLAKNFASVALGYNNRSYGYSSFSAGLNAAARGYSTVAIGQNPSVTGNHGSIALGLNTLARGDSASVAIGRGLITNGNSLAAFGQYNDTLVDVGSPSTVFSPIMMVGNGFNDSTRSNALTIYRSGSVAMGFGTETNPFASIALGISTKATGKYSTAMGRSSEANGHDGSTAMGYRTIANGDFGAFSVGRETISNGDVCTVVGQYNDTLVSAGANVASGSPLFIVGNGNGSFLRSNALTVFKNASVGLGNNTKVNGVGAIAIGHTTTAHGTGSVAIGSHTKVTGFFGSVAMGNLSEAKGDLGAIAMGYGTIANGNSSTAVGIYNDSLVNPLTPISASSPIFMVGNGDDQDNRSNAMVVLKHGSVGIGTNTPAPENKLEVAGGRIVRREGSQVVVFTGDEAQRYAHIDVGGTGHSTDHIVLGDPTSAENKVGIGTSSPTQMLDVEGNARFRSVGMGASSNDLRITSDGTLTTNVSDFRLKENIQTLHDALPKIGALRGVSFTWKNDPGAGTQHGLIAQEVMSVVPDLVFKNGNYYGVDYSEMVGLFVEAIKELKHENDDLRSQMEAMQKDVQYLITMLNN